jgi:hypothetical protein
MTNTASSRIREFWPVVSGLRREGVSWRRMPAEMHWRLGVPLVAYTLYLRIARELRSDFSKKSPTQGRAVKSSRNSEPGAAQLTSK